MTTVTNTIRPSLQPRRLLAVVALAILAALPLAAAEAQKPVAGLILTWKQDPTTTMVIDWHEDAPLDKPVLLHRAKGAAEWTTATPQQIDFPYSQTRKIYRAELTGLKPGTAYEFRPNGREEAYHFLTMPATLDRPLRIVAGGDTAWNATFVKTNKIVAGLAPDLIIWGGDYAYSDGSPDLIQKELEWHANVRDHLVGPDRRVTPVVAIIGNHEVRSVVAPYYHATFAFPGTANFGVLDFGDYLSIWLLDTDHMTKIPGKQTDWLAESLAARAKDPRRALFPVYHVPAYPSVRKDEKTTLEVREHWVPLFEKHNVSVAFEHHDHAYKRTHPLLGGKPQDDASKGVTYLGDGAWGASVRKVRPLADNPHLAKAEATNHVYFIEMPADGPLKFQAIDPAGKVFDEFQLPRRR
jgi:hypothetical protein